MDNQEATLAVLRKELALLRQENYYLRSQVLPPGVLPQAPPSAGGERPPAAAPPGSAGLYDMPVKPMFGQGGLGGMVMVPDVSSCPFSFTLLPRLPLLHPAVGSACCN